MNTDLAIVNELSMSTYKVKMRNLSPNKYILNEQNSLWYLSFDPQSCEMLLSSFCCIARWPPAVRKYTLGINSALVCATKLALPLSESIMLAKGINL